MWCCLILRILNLGILFTINKIHRFQSHRKLLQIMLLILDEACPKWCVMYVWSQEVSYRQKLDFLVILETLNFKNMFSDVFSKKQALALVKGKKIWFIGSSNMRAIYKDLLWLITHGNITSQISFKVCILYFTISCII